MSRMLPNIQRSVQAYMRDWAARGTVPAYTETLTLVFDVLVSSLWPRVTSMLVAGLCQELAAQEAHI